MATQPRYYTEKTKDGVSLPTADANAFGAPVAAALDASAKAYRGVAQDFHRIGDKLHQNTLRINAKKNKTKVFELHAAFTSELNQILYGEEGLMKRQGTSATDTYRDVETAYNGLMDKYLGMTENEDQHVTFSELVHRSRGSYEVQAAKHEAAELQKAEIMNGEATLKGLSDSLYNMRGDPDGFSGIVDQARLIIESTFGKYGADVVTSKLDDFITKGHKANIERLIAEDDTEGLKAYKEYYKDEIDSKTMSVVEKQIRVSNEIVWAQEETANIFNRFGADKEKEALEHVRANYEGKKEETLLSKVRAIYQDNRRGERTAKVKSVKEGTDYYSLLDKVGAEAGDNRRSAQLDYINMLEGQGLVKKNEAKAMREYVTSGSYPGEVKKHHAEAFLAALTAMGESTTPLTEDQLDEIMAGRMDSNPSLMNMVFGLKTSDNNQIKDIVDTINKMLRNGMDVREVPNLATAKLRNPDKPTSEIVKPFFPVQEAVKKQSFTDREFEDSYYGVKSGGGSPERAKQVYKDKLTSYTPKNAEDKYLWETFNRESVVVGMNRRALWDSTINVSRGFIPGNAYIGTANVNGRKTRMWLIPSGDKAIPLINWLIDKQIISKKDITLSGEKGKETIDYILPDKYNGTVNYNEWRGNVR